MHVALLFLHLAWLPQQLIMAEDNKCPLLRATGVAESDKTGCYIIVLNKTTSAEKFQNIQSRVVEMSEDAKVYGSVQRVAKAFTVKLSDTALESVSRTAK